VVEEEEEESKAFDTIDDIIIDIRFYDGVELVQKRKEKKRHERSNASMVLPLLSLFFANGCCRAAVNAGGSAWLLGVWHITWLADASRSCVLVDWLYAVSTMDFCLS